MVPIDNRGPAVAKHTNAGDPSRLHTQRLHNAVGVVVDPKLFEVVQPRVDPDVAGRPVENPVGRAGGRVDDRQQQLHENRANRMCTCFVRFRGNDAPRHSRSQELLKCRGPTFRPDEFPPFEGLQLREPALGTHGQQLPEPLAERRQVLRRQTGDGTERPKHRLEGRHGVGRITGEAGRV